MWATILQVETPACSWCRQASTKHPEAALRVLSYYSRTKTDSLEVVQIDHKNWPVVVAGIRANESVDGVDVLDSTSEGATIRVAARSCALPAAIEASGIVPQLPFEIAHGCDKWLLLSEKERAREFYDDLKRQGVEVKVTFSGEYAPDAPLTPRQQEVLDSAIKHGYYDYPRRVSLTELAERIGVAKSTLSQSLTMIESEVMRTAVTTPRAPGPRPSRRSAGAR